MKTTDYQTFTTKDMPEVKRRKLDVGDVWANSAECKKCGDVIRSMNRHDFKYCKCGAIAVDGGSWYARRVGELDSCIDHIELYDDAKPA